MEEVYESIETEEAFRAFREDSLGAFRWRGSRRQILKYLETEARRLAATPFRPHAFEEAFGTADRPALRIDLGDGTNLVLRGRIDRIDVRDTDDSREALIIDYKSTGRGDRGGLRNLESGLDLQLAVYMLAAESLGYSPVGALYVPVLHKPQREDSGEAPGDTKARGLIPEDRHQAIAGGTKTIVRAGKEGRIDDVARLRDVLEEARGILRIYGLAIKQGRIDIAPVRHGGRVPCDSCDFRGLCRVDPGYNRTRSSALEGFDVADEGPGPADPESRGDSP
jgi:ATP-dependent helicase/nuclease subunit B